jgi:hypothetical protein
MLKANSDDSYLTYSTCSLNPIENEAVVCAALKKLNSESKFGEEYELVDCRNKLLPFKTREGLLKWEVYDTMPNHRRRRNRKAKDKQNDRKKDDNADDQGAAIGGDEVIEQEDNEESKEKSKDEEGTPKEEVKEEPLDYKTVSFDDYFRTYKSAEDVPEEKKQRFKETFFAPEGTDEEIEAKYHLSRCIRVFPNDQNTSGFFIALFKRKPNSGVVEHEEQKVEVNEVNKVVPVQKPLQNMIRCDPSDPDIEFIQTYYGLSKDFPLEQIFTFSESMNKLFIVNKGLSDYFYADQSQSVNLIAAGAEAFLRNTSKKYSGTECIYRISQNGVYHIYPFMTKRVFYVDLETFTIFLNSSKIAIVDLPQNDFKNSIDNISCGCIVIVVKVGEKEEALVLHRHYAHINTMISDLNLHKIKTCLVKQF